MDETNQEFLDRCFYNKHTAGDTKCESCWPLYNWWECKYPKRCKCGGLIHVEVDSAMSGDWDESAEIRYCEKCRTSGEEVD